MRVTIRISQEILEELLWLSGTRDLTEAINGAIDAHVGRLEVEHLMNLAGRVDIMSNDTIECSSTVQSQAWRCSADHAAEG
jgi:hypothetical protein